MDCFSLVCAFLKVFNKFFEVKVQCIKGGPNALEKKLTIDMLVSSNLHFHSLLSYVE